MTVYDKENLEAQSDSAIDLNTLDTKRLRELEQKYSSGKDEEEDKAIEHGANPEEQENRGMGRKLRKHSEDNDPIKDFYKNPENDKFNASVGGIKGKLVKAGSKKMLVGGIGAGIVVIFFVIASLFGFLNVFKLDHIMKNIEMKAFTRYQVAMDKRSDRWIRSYLILRLSEIDGTAGGDGLNERTLFRADKVDTNNPMIDWYKTLRTSDFEQNLLEKHGIKFTSIAERTDSGTIFRGGMVTYSDKEIPFNLSADEIKAIELGEIDGFNGRLRDFVDVEVFDNNKDARRAIKTAVARETKSWQVIKRRHLRKNIQNMIGVRDWRFFDKTRTSITEKKISVRNKIIMKALPESTKSGKFIQCLFGIISCRSSSDAIDIDNRTSSPTAIGNAEKSGVTEQAKNPNGSPATNPDGTPKQQDILPDNHTKDALEGATQKGITEVGEELTFLGIKASIIKQIISKLNLGTGIVSVIDTLYRINKMFSGGDLIKMIVVARGIQAMGLYQTYMTASHQMKTGELTGEEAGQFMQTIDNISNSEGWTSIMSNSNEVAKAEEVTFVVAKDREEYCSSEHQAAIKKTRPITR